MCGADAQGRSEVGFRIEFKQGSVLSITDIGELCCSRAGASQTVR